MNVGLSRNAEMSLLRMNNVKLDVLPNSDAMLWGRGARLPSSAAVLVTGSCWGPGLVLYCAALYCAALYCAVLYCTALYCGQLVLRRTVLSADTAAASLSSSCGEMGS